MRAQDVKTMIGVLRFFVALTICGVAATSTARETIYVGGYVFPPFIELQQDQVAGATIDLIAAFNELQSDYTFTFRETSPKRRYKDFTDQRFDMLMFESVHWGWKDYPVQASNVYMEGGEVYIAYNREGRDQRFFDDLRSRRMVGILGYHYSFADFNADEDFLTKNYEILLSNNHDRNIRLILLNRPELAEVGVVTESYLERFLTKNETVRDKILKSDKMDQKYDHTILLRNDHPSLKIAYINQLLDAAKSDGVLEALRKKYSIRQ
jgi:ABC-type amino acid transport substrate-binding protein